MASRSVLDRRRLASRRPSDRRRRIAAVGLIVLLSSALLSILAYGYAIELVLPHRQLVVRIGEVEYTRGDVLKLLRARQATVELLGGRMDRRSDVIAAVLTLVENEIISQSARNFGISASDREVEAEILSTFLNAGSHEEQVSRGSRERYRALLNRVRLSEAEHFEQVRKAILREKFRQSIGESVPRVVEQVRVHRILMRQDDEIDVMRIKLGDLLGGSPGPEAVSLAVSRIVEEFSRDTPAMVRRGGDLGWAPRGVYSDYEDAFFDLKPGELSQAVQARDVPGSVYFYVVSERAAARELDDAQRDALKTGALQEWLDRQRERFEVYTSLDSEVYGWMVQQLSLAASPPR